MAKYVGFKIGKVHESHVISEYYCGGCGFPVTDHDSFCPECGGAFRECDADDLESENAKLLEGCTKWMGKAAQLEEENKKLWELCEDMNKVAHAFCEAWEGSCSKEADGMSLHAVCPIGDTSELCVFGKLHDRMRELRIEV